MRIVCAWLNILRSAGVDPSDPRLWADTIDAQARRTVKTTVIRRMLTMDPVQVAKSALELRHWLVTDGTLHGRIHREASS